jgi:PAS domain S-box-containing protein
MYHKKNVLMNKLFSVSIRSQLFSIVSILALFAAGIIVYSGIAFRNEKIGEALNDAAMLADSVANEHEKMVADARQLMLTLAQLSEIKNYNAAGLQQLLKKILRVNPKYSNIFIADQAGRVLASAIPARDTNVSDRRYFINALASGRLSSGEYTISRFTGKAVLPFAYPFRDSGGKIVGVIVMGIDLTYYRTLLDTLQLPSGSSYLLLDHKGIIMTRGINPADFAGQQYNPVAFKRMAEGPERATFIAVAHDGIKRFISYRKIRLEGERTPYMYIRSGIPVSTALSGANRALVRNLALFTSSLCFVVVFVLLIAKRSIIGRIALLERASKRLADGELHVKISDLVAGGELGRLGLTFDHMASQIALREEALSESEKRYHALFEQSPDGILLIDTTGKMIEFNEMAHRQLGYSREDFAKLNLSDIDPVESPEEIQAKIGKLLETGKAEFEVKHTTKQGEIRDVNIITKVIVLSGRPVMYAIWHDITARKQAEEALKRSEERLNTILDNVGAAIFIKDTKYRYTYANGKVCEVFGRSAEEIVGKTDREFFSAESVEEIMRSDRPVIEKGERVTREETELSSSDRVPHTYWTVKLPLRGSTGTIIGLCGISTDITERKQAEEAKDRLLNAISAANEGIAITDNKDRFIYVNDAHARIYGYLQNELIGKTWRDTVTPELQPVIEKDLSKTLHNRAVGIWSGECPALRKDSTIIPTEITATSRWDETGNYLGHICIARDITERKEAEDKIRQSEAKYRNLFDLSTDGIFIIDLDGNFLDVNSTAYTRLGYTKEEMLGLHISELDDPAFASRVSKRQAQIRDQGVAVFESAHLRKDGTAMPVEVNSRLLDYEGRQVYFSVIRDITERKIAEEQIMLALREKEILLKEIHHRVKNNLQVVASMLQLQAGYMNDREARISFEESQKRVESMALLHEKLYRAKDLARIDFREYVDDLADNLLTLNTDKSERIEMKADIEGVILDVNNSIPCGLIINELVSNALAHAFPDGRKGRIDIRMRGDNERRIVLSVSDNGIGFPEDIDFKSTTSLGMQLVNSLAIQLDGLIELDRSKGTSFTIEFQA